MMIRLIRIEMSITCLFFKGHIEQQLSIRTQNPTDLNQGVERSRDMLQSVVTYRDIDGKLLKLRGLAYILDSVFLQSVPKKLRNVATRFATALQPRQVPSGADAKFKHGIAFVNKWRKFCRSQPCHPRQRLVRQSSFALVILASGIPGVMLLAA
jgi:hypothetical protein